MKLAIALYAEISHNRISADYAAVLARKICSLLAKYGNLKFTVFFYGYLFESLSKNFKKEWELLKKFVDEKRLEFLGGGFYDAMLPLFPQDLQDKQLQKHKEVLSALDEPRGYFNSSMAWEAGMAETLEKNGFEYAVLPDSAVQKALGQTASVSGWFITEYREFFTRVLTYSQSLSDVCKSANAKDIAAALQPFKDSPNINAILLPLTEDEQDFKWVKNIEHFTFAQIVSEQKISGKAAILNYANFASSCRDALLQRPEINFLHKRLIAVYKQIPANMEKDNKDNILENLLPAMQPFYFKNSLDGIEGNVVRFEAHRQIMRAQKILFDKEKLKGIRFDIQDKLMDGRQQVYVGNSSISCLIEPNRGGIVRSLSFLPSFAEISCAMRDDGEISGLFLDHICPFDFKDDLKRRNSWLHGLSGALLQSYNVQAKMMDDRISIIMQGEQSIKYSAKEYQLSVEKAFSIRNKGSELFIYVKVTNTSFSSFKGEIATELSVGFRYNTPDGQSLSVQGKKINVESKPVLYPSVNKLAFTDKMLNTGFELNSNTQADFLLAPVLGNGLRIAMFRKAELKAQESSVFNLRLKLNGGGFFI